jgi:hypothetical protein
VTLEVADRIRHGLPLLGGDELESPERKRRLALHVRRAAYVAALRGRRARGEADEDARDRERLCWRRQKQQRERARRGEQRSDGFEDARFADPTRRWAAGGGYRPTSGGYSYTMKSGRGRSSSTAPGRIMFVSSS